MGWIAAILASGPARKALGLMLATLTLALFLLNLRRAGESAGRLAERLETVEKTSEAQRRMLDATARRPRTRDELAQRLRDGRF
jgi:type II secretory pathway component PulF